MVEVQCGDLLGPALDWATFCAVYTGMQPTIHVIESQTKEVRGLIKPITFPRAVSLTYSGAYGVEHHWNPSGDWEYGGPLIERFQINLEWDGVDGKALWGKAAHQDIVQFQMGETPLIAACRAIVAAHLGEVVSVPAELT